MRVLFGDMENFLDKFMTCTRARPYPEQDFRSEFYMKVNHSLIKKKDFKSIEILFLSSCK